MKSTFTDRVLDYLRLMLESFGVILGALGAMIGIFTTLFLIAHYTIGERSVIVAILNNAAVHLMMLCIPATLLILLAPRYRSVWLLLVLPGLLALLLWQGRLFIPKTEKTPQPGDLTVATYNSTGGATMGVFTVGELTQEIFGSADIIGFQEFSAATQIRSEDKLEILHDGLGIYSDYPIIPDTIRFVYEETEDARQARISGVRTLVDYRGTEVAVYTVHPRSPRVDLRRQSYNGHLRRSTIADVVELVREETVPVIMLCDCNFMLRTEDYRLVSQYLIDAWRAQGFGLGWTAPAPSTVSGFPIPLARPDHVWHSHHFETIDARVRYDVAYSDHYPVEAVLRLKSLG